jgi:hypothetical protein
MLILPHFVRNLIVAYLDPVLNWISAVIYADLIQHAADHFLVALQTTLDFAPLEAACAGFHHATGPGARPTHPVPQLVRVLLISYRFNWSLRQLEFQVRYNLFFKWFAGYPLFAVGPDHSTLDRFEQGVIAHQHRTLFDEVLRQIDQDFPDQRSQSQIGDTFALRANAAKESLIELLRHTARLLLHDLEAAAPESHQRVLAHIDPATLFGPADECNIYRLTPDEHMRCSAPETAAGNGHRASRRTLHPRRA